MTSTHALTAVVLAAMLTACGGKDLEKEQAKTLLNASFEKAPTTQPLLTGMDNIGTNSEKEYFDSPGGKYQKALEADKLITITSKGKIFNPADKRQWFNALDIQLTDAGKKFISGKPNTVPAPSNNTWPTVYENAAFCTKEVADITNIAMNDDYARVEYTWKNAKLTPFALDFQKTDPTEKVTCNTTTTQDGTASFERKNDVWALGQ